MAAIQDYLHALQADPGNLELKLGLARALSLSGHNQDAKGLYQEVLAKAPNDADALKGLGYAIFRLSHPEAGTGAGEASRQPAWASPGSPAKTGTGAPERVISANLKESADGNLRQGNFMAAIQDYLHALEADPGNRELKLGLARALSLSGHNQDARSLYQEVLAKAPNDADAQKGLGHAPFRWSQPEAGTGAGAAAHQPAPGSPGSPAKTGIGAPDRASAAKLKESADGNLRQGNITTAIQDYLHALEADPGNLELKLGLARALSLSGHSQDARSLYQEVLAKAPNDADALKGLGYAIFRLSQPEAGTGAGETSRQPAWASPGSPAMTGTGAPERAISANLKESADGNLRQGNFTTAIQDYLHALQADPGNLELKLGLARALSLSGHNQDAKGLYQGVLTKAPNDTDAMEGLGYALYRADHPFEAREVFAWLVARHPGVPDYQVDLARVEARLGHYSRARQILSAVLTHHPRNHEARLQLGYVKLYQGRYAGALADFSQVLKDDPTDFQALLGNARLFYFRGNVSYSYQLTSKLVQEHPNDFDALFLLASLERARHHRRQALELLARADQLSPGNPETLRLEKELYRADGMTFHASASYAREISSGNGSPDYLGFAGQDLRRFAYQSSVDFSALPRTRSSVSFDALPTSSAGATGGAVLPSQFLYRQTTPLFSGLVLRGGVGLIRFGPGGLQNIPNQSQPVSTATTSPLGFVGASYALNSKLNLDLTAAHDAVAVTPLSVRMGVMESRLDLGVRSSFAPHTELRVDLCVSHYSSMRFQQQELLGGTPTMVEGTEIRQPAHGASVTLVRNVLRSEHTSLDLGYQGRAFAFSGSPQQLYMGFFNPNFYQVHQATARLYGQLRGPLGYDFSGGWGVQQVESGQPFTQAVNLTPAFSLKVNPHLSLKLGYTYYNYSQSLGVIRGNGVTFSTDSNF
jgi:cytochrome c-type biogenesis protein CcmH/NrfG